MARLNLPMKIAIIFLALTGATTLLLQYTNISFGTVDYFTKHGWTFLIFVTLFPRLTLLVSGLIFSSIEFGGILWWLGFFITPRILVACLATLSYWKTNPVLVIFSWLIALSGESGEKIMINRQIFRNRKSFRDQFQGATIEAEYKVKE